VQRPRRDRLTRCRAHSAIAAMIIASAMVLLAYLCGSVASAVVVCKLFGLPDPRGVGSGNPGATNVLRLGGKIPGALTLAGDLLKGVIPVLLAAALGVGSWALGATALAAFAGHLYPIFLGFRGGKGMATAFGVVAALAWPVALGMGIGWLAVAGISRYSSLASMMAAMLAPLLMALIVGEIAYTFAAGVMCVLLLYRHKDNIRRLKLGTERRIGSKDSAADRS